MDRAAVRYDRAGDQHYDVISAFIKSIRGSDADAALHYLARMIEAGEDPRFIARRLIVHASEDIGMADPTALPVAVAAAQAVEFVGLPEARINLAQAVIHLALAPKSNAVIRAIGAAQADVQAGLDRAGARAPARPQLPRRGPARPRRGYQYPHDFAEGVVGPGVRAGRRWPGAATTSRPGTAPRPGSRSGPSGSGRSWTAPPDGERPAPPRRGRPAEPGQDRS